MSDTKLKMLKEVFKDFEVNNNIINTKIESINLYKKTNKLEVNILSDKPIKVKAVGYFERYLVKRFMLKEAVIHVKYIEDISQDFTKEWEDIIDYLSYKHPLTKALLRDSEILVEDNIININLKLSGADILVARGMDGILSDLLFNVFGKRYKVKYIDNNSVETKRKVEEYTKNVQTEVIKKFQEQLVVNEEKEEKVSKEILKEKQENKVKQDSNKNIEKQENKEEVEEITPLILGRNQNIKEPLVKVIDVSIDSGKIALDGEVINTDSRELKNGKFLFMFDLYDGTSTITCKSFIEKEKFKAVSRKNKIS